MPMASFPPGVNFPPEHFPTDLRFVFQVFFLSPVCTSPTSLFPFVEAPGFFAFQHFVPPFLLKFTCSLSFGVPFFTLSALWPLGSFPPFESLSFQFGLMSFCSRAPLFSGFLAPFYARLRLVLPFFFFLAYGPPINPGLASSPVFQQGRCVDPSLADLPTLVCSFVCFESHPSSPFSTLPITPPYTIGSQ